MKTSLATLFAIISLLSLCSIVSAETIISDNFNDTNGKTLGPGGTAQNLDTTNEHNPYVAPNVDLPGNPYTYNTTYNVNPITVENNVASISAGAGGSASINISSDAGYTKPTVLTISADLEPNNISTSIYFNKEGLGFYAAPQAGQSFEGFLGLALGSDGALSLIGFDDNDFSTTVDESHAYTLNGGVFDPTIFHTLTYTVDTAPGAGTITNVTLTDIYGTETYDFTTNLFTNTQTTYAGFYTRSDSNDTTAYLDNFSVTGLAVPEPSTSALMAAGLVGLALLVRSRRGLAGPRI